MTLALVPSLSLCLFLLPSLSLSLIPSLTLSLSLSLSPPLSPSVSLSSPPPLSVSGISGYYLLCRVGRMRQVLLPVPRLGEQEKNIPL